MDFNSLLKLMVHKKGSDLFITAGMPPSMKVNGRIKAVSQSTLTPEQSAAMGRAAKSYQRNGPRFKNGLKKIG